MKLSVLMAVYNEHPWITQCIERVLRQDVPGIDTKEIIVVDDASTDGSDRVIRELAERHPEIIRPIFHKQNQGKGAAIRSAVEAMTGDVCIIQDADLEYDPVDYALMLEPIISGRADCVYGSRFTGSQAKRVLFFWHFMGNKFLSLLSNICTNLNVTDMETGYKAFRAECLRSVPIRSRRFGFEPEITAKIARRKFRLFEVGINYNGRTYDEGKKITWRDGLVAIGIILKYYFIRDAEKTARNQ